MEALHCWRCGASLADLTPPIERRDECPACLAPLHVCRFCEFHDPRRPNACREPIADEVRDKERANFCGYFRPNPNAYVAKDSSGERKARSQLEALFGTGGQEPPAASSAREALDKLFGKE